MERLNLADGMKRHLVVFCLIVIGMVLSVNVYGQTWTPDSNNKWYIYRVSNNNNGWEDCTSNWSPDKRVKTIQASVSVPFACTGTMEYYMSADALYWATISYWDDKNTTHQDIPEPDRNCAWNTSFCSKNSTDPYCRDVSVSANATKVTYGCTYAGGNSAIGSNGQTKKVRLTIPVPEHIIFVDNNNPATDVTLSAFSEIAVGQQSSTTKKVYFYSFYTPSGITVSSSTNFTCSLANAPGTGQCGQNGCNNSKSSSTSTLQKPSLYYVEITYNPKSSGTHNETLTISSGSYSATIKVSGSASSIPQFSSVYMRSKQNREEKSYTTPAKYNGGKNIKSILGTVTTWKFGVKMTRCGKTVTDT